MAHVAQVKDRVTAQVHADADRVAAAEGLPSARVMELKIRIIVTAYANRASRACAEPSGMARSSGASSGPCVRPVSATRSGWYSALPLRPVALPVAAAMARKSRGVAAAAARGGGKECPARLIDHRLFGSARGAGGPPNDDVRHSIASAGQHHIGSHGLDEGRPRGPVQSAGRICDPSHAAPRVRHPLAPTPSARCAVEPRQSAPAPAPDGPDRRRAPWRAGPQGRSRSSSDRGGTEGCRARRP